MPPLLEPSEAALRAALLLLPFLFSAAAILINRPGTRMLTGAFLASLWNFSLLVPVNLLAVHMQWWTFHAGTHLFLGLPFDVLLGWSVWWGAALYLALRGRYLVLALLAALWIDLLVMPRMEPLITLYGGWLWGEALLLATCFLPGWLIASSTARDTHVAWRAAAQAAITGILVLALLPAAILEHEQASPWAILELPAWQLSLLLNALLIPLVLGLAGAQEFAERGNGTPIPFDPPKRLVVTGPYAFVANPMQISLVASLAILGIGHGSLLVAAAAVVAVIFCLGLVRWHHTIDMEPRFGEDWQTYRRNVRNWIPRWKPWIREPATVYFADYCNICRDTQHWLQRLGPVGLRIEDASQHPDALTRVTYRYPDGSEVRGIYAIASCLGHTNLALAWLGWFMRLPGVRHVLQVLIDGTGERALPRAAPNARTKP